MKKLFRKRELTAPRYPTHETARLAGRAIVAAGIVMLAAGAACDIGEDPGGVAPPADIDAGPDAGPTGADAGAGGIAPLPDASTR